MSHIIELRQRIKAVSILQKTTHAMRLTSRSTHARLHKKKEFLERYRQELEQVLVLVRQELPVLPEASVVKPKELLVVVGSQKGLCGGFNNRLRRFFEQSYPEIPSGTKLIVIGKRIVEYLVGTYSIHYSFETFNPTNFFAVTTELYQHILGPENYTKVSIVSNRPVSFFIQKATQTTFDVPLYKKSDLDTVYHDGDLHGLVHLYDQPPLYMIRYLEKMLMKVKLEEVLFNSLIAEQAARFLSMDASTTNAEKILEGMTRDYNKLRQAAITRELTDLSSSLM